MIIFGIFIGIIRKKAEKRSLNSFLASFHDVHIKNSAYFEIIPLKRRGFVKNFQGLRNDKIDKVNSTLINKYPDNTKRIPSDIRFVQLAWFHEPEVDGKEYSFGIMLHYGQVIIGDDSREFAVLFPYESDKNVPLYLLSNNMPHDHDKLIKEMTHAFSYVRRRKWPKETIS